MRQWIAIPLLLVLAGISSGGMDYVHHLDHQRAAIAEGRRAPIPVTPPANGGNDEDNCVICFVLHLPFLAQIIHAAIAGLAMLVIAIVVAPHLRMLQCVPQFIDCRGPPLA